MVAPIKVPMATPKILSLVIRTTLIDKFTIPSINVKKIGIRMILIPEKRTAVELIYDKITP
jgi:hypothetical protein